MLRQGGAPLKNLVVIVMAMLMVVTLGCAGPVGPAGPAGPQGESGLQGEAGTAGPRGGQGERGLQGEAGIAGPQGGQGERGLQGELGTVGPQGEQGERGLQGELGPAGPAGTPGQDGERGPSGPPGGGGAIDVVALVHEARASVVQVDVASGRGTGFYIDRRGSVLTAAHVLAEGMATTQIVVTDWANREWAYRVDSFVAAANGWKLVPVVPRSNTDALGFADSTARGLPVAILGYPAGTLDGALIVTVGHLAATAIFTTTGESYHVIDAVVEKGSSGSPVLNSSGDVIGLVQSGGTVHPFGYAIDLVGGLN